MGIFFKDKKKVVAPKLGAVSSKVGSAPQTLRVADSYPSSSITSGMDYPAYLDGEIRKRDQQGPDYLEFSDTLKDLEGKVVDEKTRYEVNFATYKRMGLTSQKLVASANQYLKVLDGEKSDFDNVLLTSRAQKIEQKNAEMEANKHAIEDLTAQIKKKQEENNRIAGEITADTLKLNTEEMAFNSAYEARKALIGQHINNITIYCATIN